MMNRFTISVSKFGSSNKLFMSGWGSREETQRLANWLNVGIVKQKGRAFNADHHLIAVSKAVTFPQIKCTTLNDASVIFPDDIKGKAKLVIISFKQYGFTLVRSWMDPFILKYPSTNSDVQVVEICFVEYGFLSMAKGMFINTLKSKIAHDRHSSTAFAFGGVQTVATQIDLPNIFTGYAILLDGNNKIRWRGCGQAEDHELESLFRCTDELCNFKVGSTHQNKGKSR